MKIMITLSPEDLAQAIEEWLNTKGYRAYDLKAVLAAPLTVQVELQTSSKDNSYYE